jgi:xylitol oxidase
MERNWAGNIAYRGTVARPTSLPEVQELVAGADVVRPLGTRHSFNEIADTDGLQVSLEALPASVRFDGHSVTVSAGTRYGDLAPMLEERGLALPNLASLPHISIAGAVSTGTHGSGTGSLATAVSSLTLVGADGSLRRVSRADPDFAGTVVGLGALGVVVEVTLDLVGTFELSQAVYPGLGFFAVLEEFDAVMSAGYSVSLFTKWAGPVQIWVKSPTVPADLFEVPYATEPVHMIAGESVSAVTTQCAVPGPWLDRLPHFRLAHKPSSGAELQSEYLVPRSSAVAALTRLRALASRIAPLLLVSEIRTVAADSLWLSGAYGTDAVAVHFTWRQDPAVFALLPVLEEALLPLGARPHWGKCFAAADVGSLYPRWRDFASLRRVQDPAGKFLNPFLERVL